MVRSEVVIMFQLKCFFTNRLCLPDISDFPTFHIEDTNSDHCEQLTKLDDMPPTSSGSSLTNTNGIEAKG